MKCNKENSNVEYFIKHRKTVSDFSLTVINFSDGRKILEKEFWAYVTGGPKRLQLLK